MKEPRFIEYGKLYSKSYLRFAKKVKSDPYTRNQVKFVEYLLRIKKDISVIGNMEQVFKDVRYYLRMSKNTK